jgi:hypothetical protein
MAHDRHAALDEEADGLGHAHAALQLDGAAAGLLEDAHGGAESLLLAFLVGPEWHVDDDEGPARAAHHRSSLQDHHL